MLTENRLGTGLVLTKRGKITSASLNSFYSNIKMSPYGNQEHKNGASPLHSGYIPGPRPPQSNPPARKTPSTYRYRRARYLGHHSLWPMPHDNPPALDGLSFAFYSDGYDDGPNHTDNFNQIAAKIKRVGSQSLSNFSQPLLMNTARCPV